MDLGWDVQDLDVRDAANHYFGLNHHSAVPR